MKTRYQIAIVALLALAAVGCAQNDLAVDTPQVRLTARMEADVPQDTKTTLSGLENGLYYPLWSAEDQIAVYIDGKTAPSKFTLTLGEGTTVAQFTGDSRGTEYFALYPYSIAGTVADGAVSLTLPAEQKYTADTFCEGSFPMVATGTNGSLQFSNLCAVLKISLKGTALVKSIKLTANDNKLYLSGAASVQCNYGSAPQLVMAEGGSNSVTLDCKGLELKDGETKDAYIVIPAQNYVGGITIDIDTYTETVTHKIESDLTFDRSQLRQIKNLKLDVKYDGIIADAVPDNEIWYTTTDGIIALCDNTIGNANVVSNEYVNGKGVITLDAPLIYIPSYVIGPNGWHIDKLYLPRSIQTVESFAFDHWADLEEITINSTSLQIKGNPVVGCQKLSKIQGPLASADGRCLVVDGVLYAFAPYGLSEYTTPDGVVSINSWAFQYHKLKQLTISEGVKMLGDSAIGVTTYYQEKTTLEYVYLPKSLEQMHPYAFIWNNSIKAFYGECEFITEDNLALILENGAYFVAYASGADTTEYTIPEGVQYVENYAFYCASNLKKVNFPDSFIDKGGEAFKHSTNIETITGKYVLEDNRSMVVDGTLVMLAGAGLEKYVTPKGVTKLGYSVLGHNSTIKEYVISDEVVEVLSYGYLFNGAENLETVTISANMKYLGYDPFQEISWVTPKIRTVYCRAIIPPIVYHNQEDYQFTDLTIYVPEESLNLYLASDYWKPYSKYIKGYKYTDLPTPDYYISTDYSQDGKVTLLQRAKEGNGIDIVLMGDGYSDRQIADGTYERVMKLAYEKLFTEEPYKSHKELFNVYYVTAVSATEGYEYGNTAFGGWFGDGTAVGGSDNVAMNYATNAIEELRLNNAMIVVMMNSDRYAGTCYMYYPDGANDYGSGLSVSYFPVGTDEAQLEQLLHHETCGHGFTKLADEYAYDYMGAVPADQVAATQSQWAWGWWKNVDFTSDTTQVLWAKFIADERYKYDGLGAFEGGMTYWTGVWRPTEDSIMRYNTGGFNAPSREAIYYRIHKLAYGDSWQYDYEKFVEYDAINRKTGAEQAAAHTMVLRPFAPTAPPVVVGKTWREALGK